MTPLFTLLAAVLAAAGAGSAAAAAAPCLPGAQLLAAPGPAKRCVDLPERIRIELELRQGPIAVVAKRHRLTPDAVSGVAADRRNRLIDGDGARPTSAVPGCSLDDGKAEVELRWMPTGTGRQRVVVAFGETRLRRGDFVAGPPLKPSVAAATWRRTVGQQPHTWTVLTETPSGWRVGELGTFDGPLCAIDYQGR